MTFTPSTRSLCSWASLQAIREHLLLDRAAGLERHEDRPEAHLDDLERRRGDRLEALHQRLALEAPHDDEEREPDQQPDRRQDAAARWVPRSSTQSAHDIARPRSASTGMSLLPKRTLPPNAHRARQRRLAHAQRDTDANTSI